MRRRDIDNALSRRDFVRIGGACGAHMLLMAAGAPALGRSLFAAVPRGRVVREAPWGRLEEVSDGIWALVSTPLEDRLTLCNGGIIAGRDGVMVIESFASDNGAAWMATQARALAGRWPTHAVLTHYHGDHSGGVAGFQGDGGTSRILLTEDTRDLVRGSDERRERSWDSTRGRLMTGAEVLSSHQPTEVDLGGRRVRIVPRHGHTRSDVTVELDDPSVVFCGDLVWNGMFPNYVDAIPSALVEDVRALMREEETLYVPGHGSLADGPDMATYLDVLDAVEAGARQAIDAGTPVADAAADFQLPPSLGEWFMFNPRYFEVAFTAWARELG